jgi:hypothetical protein
MVDYTAAQIFWQSGLSVAGFLLLIVLLAGSPTNPVTLNSAGPRRRPL